MSIISASITPHPPILIPAIGKENLEQLKKTQTAFKEIEDNLYQAQIDTLVVISPHGLLDINNFTVNLAPEFSVGFEDFGDFATKLSLRGDVSLAQKITEASNSDLSVRIISEAKLDHGTGVPTFMLTKNLKNLRLLPIFYSGADFNAHYEFGKFLQSIFIETNDRITIVASGDLSHRLTKNAPAGYSAKGAKFDNKLIELLKNKKNQEILDLNPALIDDAGECGLKSIIILLGILDQMNYEPKLLSYEGPFGVGYLVMDFCL